MQPKIPFHKSFVTGKEIDYITQAISAQAIAGDGAFTQQCVRFLEERFGIRRVIMVPSCTAALEMSALLCDFQPGEEAILPSFTFVTTATAIMRAGGKPVFVDIRSDTLNIDENLLEAAITPRTKAIFPIHYAGIGCAMDRILAIAEKHGLRVCEDAAQGVNAYFRDQALGTIGHLGAYSFHDTKNYTCGEGGALCVNDPALIERAEVIRDKGTNRKKFFRGQVDKYTWVDMGSSFVPSELTAAFLLAQLEALEPINERRRKIFQQYCQELQPLEDDGLLRLPRVPEGCRGNAHIFYILLPDMATRDGLLASFKDQNIGTTFHYVPLHSSPMGLKLGYREGDLPCTEDLSGRLLRLPIYPDLTEGEQQRVVEHLTRFLKRESVGRPRVSSVAVG